MFPSWPPRWLHKGTRTRLRGDSAAVGGAIEVPVRARATFASSKGAGWDSPTHISFAEHRTHWVWRRISAHPESAFGKHTPPVAAPGI